MIEVVLNDRLVRDAQPRTAWARSRAASRLLTAHRRRLAWLACAGQEDSRQVQVRGAAQAWAPLCLHADPRRRRRASCSEDDTIGDLKKLVAAHAGARPLAHAGRWAQRQRCCP
jgi:hypothetical protein